MCYCVTSVLLYEIWQCIYQLCVNLYKLATLHYSETKYIPYERSLSQLSDGMLDITYGLGDNLRGQKYCHSTVVFLKPI